MYLHHAYAVIQCTRSCYSTQSHSHRGTPSCSWLAKQWKNSRVGHKKAVVR